jgi:hypothetical protein
MGSRTTALTALIISFYLWIVSYAESHTLSELELIPRQQSETCDVFILLLLTHKEIITELFTFTSININVSHNQLKIINMKLQIYNTISIVLFPIYCRTDLNKHFSIFQRSIIIQHEIQEH